MEIAESVCREQNIFFAQLADPNTVRFSVEATRFMSGKFPLMMFVFPELPCHVSLCFAQK